MEKDYISEMEVSSSVKTELYKLSDALDETRRLAKDSGKFNYGELYQLGYDEYSFMQNWSVSNCGEVWSAREAILNVATFDELTYQSVYSESGKALDMCDNCQHTFGKK